MEGESAQMASPVLAPESLLLKPQDLERGRISNFSQQVKKEFRKKVRQAGLRPLLFHYDQTLTQYDRMRKPGDLQQALDQQLVYDLSSPVLLWRMIRLENLNLVLLLLSTFVFASGYFLEREGGNHLALLYTQPIKLRGLYIKKFAVGLGWSLLYFGVMVLFLLLMGLAFDPRGVMGLPLLRYLAELENPMTGGNFSASYDWISLGTFLQENYLLSVSQVIFAYSFLTMGSVFLKKRFSVYVCLALFLGGCGLLLSFFPSTAAWNPMAYLDPEKVVTGDVLIRNHWLGSSLGKGLVIFSIGSIFCFVLGLFCSHRSDASDS